MNWCHEQGYHGKSETSGCWPFVFMNKMSWAGSIPEVALISRDTNAADTAMKKNKFEWSLTGLKLLPKLGQKKQLTNKGMARNRSHPLTIYQTDTDKIDLIDIMNQSTICIEVRLSEYPSSDKHFQIYNMFLEESRLLTLWQVPWTSGWPLKLALATLRNHSPLHTFSHFSMQVTVPHPQTCMHACMHSGFDPLSWVRGHDKGLVGKQ